MENENRGILDTRLRYEDCYDNCRKDEEPKVVINNYTKEPTVSDYIKLGFGFYIGFTAARTLKHLLIAKLKK